MRIRVYKDGKCLKKLRFKQTKRNNQVYLLIKYYMNQGFLIRRCRVYSLLGVAVLVLKEG